MCWRPARLWAFGLGLHLFVYRTQLHSGCMCVYAFASFVPLRVCAVDVTEMMYAPDAPCVRVVLGVLRGLR